MSYVPPSQRPPTLFSRFSSFISDLNPLVNKKQFQSHHEKRKYIEMKRFRMKIFTIAGAVAVFSGLGLYRYYFGDEESRVNPRSHPMLKDDSEEIKKLKMELASLKDNH